MLNTSNSTGKGSKTRNYKKKNAKCKLKDNAFTCFDVQMHICNSNFTKNQI